MRVLYALCCERAQRRNDGRVDVVGVFHQLFAPGFPAMQEAMTLALALEWGPGEEGHHELRIDLLDPQASPVLTVQGHTDVPTPRPHEPPPRTELVLAFDRVVFPRPGVYGWRLRVAGREQEVAPLHLLLLPGEAA